MSSSNQRPANKGFRSLLRCAISHYRPVPSRSAPEPRQGVLPGLLPLAQQRPLPFRSELANPSDGPLRSDRSGSGTTPACSGSRSSATSRTFRQCTEEDRWAAGQGVDQPARRVAYGSLNSECRCLKLVDTFRRGFDAADQNGAEEVEGFPIRVATIGRERTRSGERSPSVESPLRIPGTSVRDRRSTHLIELVHCNFLAAGLR